MIVLIVTYNCKPGMAQTFVKSIQEEGLDKKCQSDPGNIMYDYYFPAIGGDEVVLIEKWESMELAQEHLKAPHMDRVRALKDQYVEETIILQCQTM